MADWRQLTRQHSPMRTHDTNQSRIRHPDLTNFGQSNLGQSVFGQLGMGPANFGQSILGQSILGQSISGSCVCHGGAPKGWGPKPEKIGSRTVEPQRVGPRTVEGPKFRVFFPSPATMLILSSSLGGPFVEFWWCLKRRSPQMCTFGALHESLKAQSCTYEGPGLQNTTKI